MPASDVEPDEGHELRGGPLPGQLHPRAVPHHRRHHAGGHRKVSLPIHFIGTV